MSTDRNAWKAVVGGVLMGLVAASSASGHVGDRAGSGPSASPPVDAAKTIAQTVERRTLLPDGSQLSLAADGQTLVVREPRSSRVARNLRLPNPRIGASLTLLPSGRVLIWGGNDAHGRPQSSGFWFDPDLKTLETAEDLALTARAGHSATVLTDGRVLFAGGYSSSVPAEVWDELNNTIARVETAELRARAGHRAELRADGRVRVFGGVEAGRMPRTDTLYDPATGRFAAADGKAESPRDAGLAGSAPAQGEREVSPDARLAVRFTQPVRMADLNSASVTLLGPGGNAALKVVPAENGRLVFATPAQELFPGSKYTLLIDGVRAMTGDPLPLIAVDFQTAALPAHSGQGADAPIAPATGTEISTGSHSASSSCRDVDGRKQPCRAASDLREGIWTPGRENTDGRWRVTGRQPALVGTDILSRITEAVGFTTVIGRILRVDGAPVGDVDVSIGGTHARTDADGQFTLYNPPAGKQELYVDGSTANSAKAEYGQFVVGVEVKTGGLTQLPYTMYLPRISARDKVKIASPLARDVVLTHPDMPGLQVQIPAGTVIRDRKGRLVRELAIVPTPVNRAPFPVADNYPMYFTLEPGGAVIQGLTPEAAQGVRVFYPNYDRHAKGTQANFWIYDPAEGWRIYGKGRVTSDGTRFAPEAGVALHQTMGGSYSIPSNEPPTEDRPPCHEACGSAQSGGGASAGDPIDLKSGEFFYSETDIAIKDIVPLTLSRDYRPHDLKNREFGFGTAANFNYKLYAVPSTNDVQLILPSGLPIDFTRVSGSGSTGVWQQSGSMTAYAGARLESVSDPQSPTYGHAYRLTFRNGNQMQFGAVGENQLQWTQDRFGNRTEFAYDAGFVSDIVSPSGRSLSIEYDSNNRIESVTDHTGRTWSYTYNSFGLLDNVIFPDQTYRHYEYKVQSNGITLIQHRVEAIFDQRGHRVLYNEFEPVGLGWSGRVVKQTQADGGVYNIQYDHVDGATTGVLVTQPDGSKRRIVFDSSTPYPKADTIGYGTPLAQTVEFERNTYGQVTARIDSLGRRVEYQYDGNGQVTTIAYLADTAQQKTLHVAYTGLGDLATITDPINRTMSFGYENGCLISIADTSAATTEISCNSAGQPVAVTDPLDNTATFQYLGYELAALSDPLGRTVSFRYDALGRLIAAQDAEGNVTHREYDVMDRVSKIVDPSGGVTEIDYDENGNIEAVLLPNQNGFTYTYDANNHQLTRTDALSQSEVWTYDLMGRAATFTDRKGQVSTYVYDTLGRPKTVTYQDSSSITATYDAGNRLLALADSVSGALGWDYDDFDRVVQATSQQGNILYEYDDIGRRIGMTSGSQPKVEYEYDAADRLTRILQGSEIVDFDYDGAGRLAEMTLPNDVKAGYAYNSASQLTGIAWLKPDNTPLGDIGYGYDSRGRLVAQTGSFASQVLPEESSGSNAFDDNSRQTQHNGQALNYDLNGNLTADASRTYIWNARNQLIEVKQGINTVASFSYDALGRRQVRSEAGQTTEYLYDGLDPVQEIQGATPNPILTGLGIDQRYARNDAGGRTYFLTDMLGSTRALTDNSGAVVQRYDYAAYGQVSQTSGGFSNPYQYTGRERDVSGLYFYRARYYSAGMGRFLAEDPAGFAGGLNGYAYVRGNPLGFNDPDGRLPLPVITGLIGAGAGFVGSLAAQLVQNGGNIGCVKWGDVFVATGMGAISGALAPATLLGAMGVGAGANLAQYGITNALNGDPLTWQGAAWSAGTGALGGAVGGPVARAKLRWDEASPWLEGGAAKAMNEANDAALNTGARDLTRNGLGGFAGSIERPGSAACGCG